MSILYPIAETAEQALNAPKAFAAREREAERVAAGRVEFVTEATGPAFETREAALDAYAGRVDDERPGRRSSVPSDARWCELKSFAAPPEGGRRKVRAPAHPVNKNGRRWPAPPPPAPLIWRLSVSYWRIRDPAEVVESPHTARHIRRDPLGEGLSVGTLRALASQPMRPVKPQQPLDIGLFETRPPEAPHIIMPDE
jgi:hypothetical protein